ncbi:MAG: metallophosphoesterase family protein [Spirochaetales bacterium]|nr:metallophosphoesterase family protein [Spirochaetales bacterium]
MKQKILAVLTAVIFMSCMATIKKYGYTDGPILTFSEDAHTSVTINWLTSENKSSQLQWGEEKSNLSKTETTPAGTDHHVTLRNLQPNTTYYYKINEELFLQEEELIPNDKIFSYTTPDKNSPLDFVIMGDMQAFNEETLRTNRVTMKKLSKLDTDCIVQLGDITEVGTDPESWHWFMKSSPIAASTIPFLSVVGNHDYYWEIPNAANFKKTLKYNYPSTAKSKSAYYSIDIKNAHFIFLDNFDLWPGMTPSQKRWVEKDLEEASKNSKWIFIFMHHPPFTTSNEGDKSNLHRWLLPLTAKYNVDAIFWAHMHLYEHYEYQYGKNGYTFGLNDKIADYPLHMFCSGGGGARLDSLYGGFTDHEPFDEKMLMWNRTEKKVEMKVFEKRPWNPLKLRPELADIVSTTQDWTKPGFEMSKVFYYYPFDTKDAYDNLEYSTNKENLYTDSAKFLGFKYGENALHYIRVLADDKECTISVHYYNGNEGDHGQIMETPFGHQQKWNFQAKSR